MLYIGIPIYTIYLEKFTEQLDEQLKKLRTCPNSRWVTFSMFALSLL